jgi:hypothetical protein
MNFIEQFLGMTFEWIEALYVVDYCWQLITRLLKKKKKFFEMGMQELQGVSKTQTQNTNQIKKNL